MSNLLTVKDICGLSKMSRGTVIGWIREGKLPAMKLGGGRVWLVREIDFKRFMRQASSNRL